MNSEKILDISWATILKIVAIVFCLYIFYLIKDILVLFLFALIISIIFNPVIDFFQKKRIPRALGAIIIYFGFFGTICLLIYLATPFFISEIQQFSQDLPQYFEKIISHLQILGIETPNTLEDFIQMLERLELRWLIGPAADIFEFLAAIFVGFTLAFFLSLEEKTIEKIIQLIFPKKDEAYAITLWEKSQKKVIGWFGVRVLGCIFVFIACYFVFSIFDIRYTFTLSLIAGILNFIPFIGPIFTSFLLFIFVIPVSLSKTIFVILAFALIQQIENNLITPILAKKFIDISPALVLTSIVIGGALLGISGAILAIPLAGILFEFLKDFLQKRKEEENLSISSSVLN